MNPKPILMVLAFTALLGLYGCSGSTQKMTLYTYECSQSSGSGKYQKATYAVYPESQEVVKRDSSGERPLQECGVFDGKTWTCSGIIVVNGKEIMNWGKQFAQSRSVRIQISWWDYWVLRFVRSGSTPDACAETWKLGRRMYLESRRLER
jgi:hypothetical protein